MNEARGEDTARLRRTAWLLALMGVLMLLALVSRKLGAPFLRNEAWDVLRTCDLFTLFLLSPIGIALFWELFSACEGTARRWTSLLFVLGVFLLGMGFGMHEPTNAMQIAGYSKIKAVAGSLGFFDDGLGHWLFFAGMALCSTALAFTENAKPLKEKAPSWLLATLCFGGLCGAVSLYGNLAFEKGTNGDMLTVTLCLLGVFAAHWKRGFAKPSKIPLSAALYLCYGLGGAATLATWLLAPALRS